MLSSCFTWQSFQVFICQRCLGLCGSTLTGATFVTKVCLYSEKHHQPNQHKLNLRPAQRCCTWRDVLLLLQGHFCWMTFTIALCWSGDVLQLLLLCSPHVSGLWSPFLPAGKLKWKLGFDDNFFAQRKSTSEIKSQKLEIMKSGLWDKSQIFQINFEIES